MGSPTLFSSPNGFIVVCGFVEVGDRSSKIFSSATHFSVDRADKTCQIYKQAHRKA